MNTNQTHTHDPLEGKIVYVLVMTILVQFLYPLSINESPLIQIAFQIFYMSLFVTGIYLVSSNRRIMWSLVVAAVAWLIVGTIFVYDRELQWANVIGYLLVIFFQTMLTYVLVRYIFRTSIVSTDVLLAACTVYLLLGAIFVPIYGIIETFTYFPDQTSHAFVDGMHDVQDGPFPWQTLVYYSYATLSTLGYGDVLPVTFWARSAATFQSVLGVLYTAVIVARLVGLYAAGEVEDEFERQRL